MLTSVAAAWALTTTILLACGAATRSFKFFDTDVLLWWAALTPVAHYAAALAGGALLRMQAADTHARRTALVVGAGPLGHKVAQMLKGRKAFGHDFVGYLEDREPHRCPEVTHRHLLGRLDDLPLAFLQERVIFALQLHLLKFAQAAQAHVEDGFGLIFAQLALGPVREGLGRDVVLFRHGARVGFAPILGHQGALGFGSELPVASSATKEGRLRNQRVEVWLD